MPMEQVEAISFVTNNLCIPDVQRKLNESKYELLCEIVRAFHEKIPFQSLILLSVPLPKRRKPILDEILSDIQSFKGGLCYTINTFSKLLLEALGYIVFHVLSTVKFPDNHMITIACIDGVKYLVENGCGYPTLQPIPLDFKDESPVYENSFIKFKLVWVSEYVIERRQTFLTPNSTWQFFYSFSMRPRELHEFDGPMIVAYTDPNAIPFHVSFRAMKFCNGKAIGIRDMTFLEEDDNHILHEFPISSEAELLDTVKKHFPALEDTARKALTNWNSS